MAARREDLPSRCLSLLEEVKDLIETHNSEQSCSETSSESGQRVSLPSSALPQTQTSTNQQRVMQNFRSLFAPYVTSASSCRPPPAKKPRGYFQVKETWTHDFFCLASTSAECVPRRPEKMALQNAGLGRKKVVFSSKGSFVDVKEKLESIYPKLKDAGGFELLRMGSPNSKLFLINPPAGGYSVPFLRDTAGLGQALAYIRPLQMDLDTSVGESAQQPEQVCVCIAATHNIS